MPILKFQFLRLQLISDEQRDILAAYEAQVSDEEVSPEDRATRRMGRC